jgi:uncharacterized protein with ATP-grasp and redox domains
MKTYPECLPCFLRQATQAAKLAGADGPLQKKVTDEVKKFISGVDITDNPPALSRNLHRLVRSLVNNPDPYKEIKDRYNKMAMSMYAFLKAKVDGSADRLMNAIRVAIAGNVIDFGAQLEFDLDRDVDDVLNKPFMVNEIERFKHELAVHKNILYLGDNTGETVFDRILIEELIDIYGSKITYVVKESPILNDATMEDAAFAGIDKIARVISSGADSPGIVLRYASDEFNVLFNSAPLIISKGQGNFESLCMEEKPIFFLFKIKCDVLADYTKLPLGSIVLKYNGK